MVYETNAKAGYAVDKSNVSLDFASPSWSCTYIFEGAHMSRSLPLNLGRESMTGVAFVDPALQNVLCSFTDHGGRESWPTWLVVVIG
jgi:hypothetical protein